MLRHLYIRLKAIALSQARSTTCGCICPRSKRKIDQRGTAALGFKKSEHYEKLPKDINMRFVPFPLPATMDTLRDRLIVISWANMTGILISSKEIADHFSDYFDSMWKMARR